MMTQLRGRAIESAAERDRYIAEIARLRARPTEEEVIRTIMNKAGWTGPWAMAQLAARAVLALFPKVQP